MGKLKIEFQGDSPLQPKVMEVKYTDTSLTATGFNVIGYYIGVVTEGWGFQYCTDTDGNKTDVSANKTEGLKQFTASITGLTSETLYYIRGYVIVDSVKIYGETWYRITTEANNIVVGVQEASSITAASATLSAAYTSNAANISAAKLQYCTDIDGEITDVAITPVTSPLTTTLTELTAATTYYFRCKLTSETVDTLGEWKEFTTLPE